MKRKFLICILSITIIFNSFNFSYADSVDDYNSKSVASALVIAPEVYSILMSALAMTGIVLTVDDSISFIRDIYSRVDSGVFSSYPSSKKLEEEIIKNTKKEPDPNNPKKSIFVLSDNILKDLIGIFNSTIKDNGDGTVTISNSPFNDLLTYISTQSETIIKNVECGTAYNKRGIYDMVFSPYYEDNLLRFNVNLYDAGTSNLVYTSHFKFWSFDGTYIGFTIYDNPATSDNRYNTLSVVLDNEDGTNLVREAYSNKIFITYPLNTYKYNGSFNSSNIKNEFSNIEDLPYNDNIEFLPPSIVGGGSDDNNGSDDNSFFNPPSYPSLDEIDFSGFDFSSLGSLFDNFKNKFPFSLPFDLHNLLSAFSVEPEAPVFEFPLFSESITIDLTEFDELANIVRMFVVIGWVVGLFILTKTFGG